MDVMIHEKMEQTLKWVRSFARKWDHFANGRDRSRENGTISRTDAIFRRKRNNLANGHDRLRENGTISRQDAMVCEKTKQSRKRVRSFARKWNSLANGRDLSRENVTISPMDAIVCEKMRQSRRRTRSFAKNFEGGKHAPTGSSIRIITRAPAVAG